MNCSFSSQISPRLPFFAGKIKTHKIIADLGNGNAQDNNTSKS